MDDNEYRENKIGHKNKCFCNQGVLTEYKLILQIRMLVEPSNVDIFGLWGFIVDCFKDHRRLVIQLYIQFERRDHNWLDKPLGIDRLHTVDIFPQLGLIIVLMRFVCRASFPRTLRGEQLWERALTLGNKGLRPKTLKRRRETIKDNTIIHAVIQWYIPCSIRSKRNIPKKCCNNIIFICP